jgi:hypothetical protein
LHLSKKSPSEDIDWSSSRPFGHDAKFYMNCVLATPKLGFLLKTDINKYKIVWKKKINPDIVIGHE